MKSRNSEMIFILKKSAHILFMFALIVFCVAENSSAQTYNMASGTQNTCSGNFYDSGGSGSQYSNNENVTETFCSNAGNCITVTFNAFALDNSTDILTIYDGPSAASPLIGSFQTNNSPGTVTATGTCLTFVFTSDGSGRKAGWAATISCGVCPPPNNCMAAGTSNACAGNFYDSGCNGSNYSNSEDKTTTICSNAGTCVRATFTMFNTESGYDYLYIYDGPTTSSTLLGTYTGTTSPGTVTATSGCLTFFFHSDGSVTDPGWAATISCVACPPPVNNECATATTLANCGFVVGTVSNGSQSLPGCVGTADEDVWYAFAASATTHNITVIPSASMNPVVQVYSGTCGALTSLTCTNAGGTGVTETISLTGLTIGTTYLIRVYDFAAGAPATTSFSIMVDNGGVPENDNPCCATPLTVGTSCSYSTVSNVGATATTGVPVPGCGGYAGGDVWFTITVPASGRVVFDTRTNSITDVGMAIYSGTNCSALTLIECDADDSQNGAMAMICRTGSSGICTSALHDCAINGTLTPGATIWVRVWENGNDVAGNFDICAYEPQPSPAASTCANATTISTLPYTVTGLTTCCTGNEYTSSDACGSVYMGGEDYVFKYTPAANEVIDLTTNNTLTYTGVFITKGCPSAGSSQCTAQATSASGNPALCGVSLTAGTTYYIIIDTDPSPTCTGFDMTISTNTTVVPCNLNYAVSSIAYSGDSYVAGTAISVTDDKFAAAFTTIPFTFCFDGNEYTRTLISSNGYLIFDPVSCSTNLPGANAVPGAYSSWPITTAIPNTTEAPRNAILGPWQDIDPSVGGTIRYQTLGVTPNRRFVVSFYDLPMYSFTCNTTSSLNFRGQIKLFETSNNIEIHLFNKKVCTGWNSGAAILGLHNYNGTIAVVPAGHNYPTQWTASSEAWRFAPSCTCAIAPPLPINLVFFDAKYNPANNKVDLNWETSSETNNDYFTVEKSDDGFTFSELTKVKGAGNSTSTHHYSTVDSSPFARVSYYRLKQTDYDGTETFSEIKAVMIDDYNTFSIVPNPAKTTFDVVFNSSSVGKTTLMIHNIQGKKVFSETFEISKGTIQKTIDATRLQSGVYHVTILSDDKLMSSKLIIQ